MQLSVIAHKVVLKSSAKCHQEDQLLSHTYARQLLKFRIVLKRIPTLEAIDRSQFLPYYDENFITKLFSRTFISSPDLLLIKILKRL